MRARRWCWRWCSWRGSRVCSPRPGVGTLMDDPRRDGITVAMIVFIAGALYGAATYWIGGGALAIGIRGAGGAGTARGARHVLAFAAAPLALALFVVWPIRLAAYGDHVFHSGGARLDQRGPAGSSTAPTSRSRSGRWGCSSSAS